MKRLKFSAKLAGLAALLGCLAAICWAGELTQKAAKEKSPSSKTPAVSAAAPQGARERLRDPFAPLVSENRGGGGNIHLPPGIGGLQVSTLRLEGIVKGPEAMVAIVSNPENGVYFIHEGDKLFDGEVEKIDLDAVTFKEYSKDAFGRVVEREVTKQLYPNAGEQQ